MKATQLLLPALALTLTMSFSACSDSGNPTLVSNGSGNPPAPTSGDDGTVVGNGGSGTGGTSITPGGTGGNGGGEGGGEPNAPIESANLTPIDEVDEGGQPIPEPATLLLLGSGLAAAGYYRRRKEGEVELED